MKHYRYKIRRQIDFMTGAYVKRATFVTTRQELNIGGVYGFGPSNGLKQGLYRIESLVKVIDCD